MVDRNDISLEGSSAVWTMPRIDGDFGGTYTGTFTFRCFLDPLRYLQAGKEYRALLGELAALATDDEGRLAFALTQLKHRILKAPPFWTSTEQDSGIAGNIGDLNVISRVLDAAMMAQAMFQEKIDKEREETLNYTIKVAEKLLTNKAEEEK